MIQINIQRNHSIKSISFIFLFCLSLFYLPIEADSSQESTIQQLINNAEPGETIVIPSGDYEGPIQINKPLTILGDGNVTLLNKEKTSTLLIKSSHVTISNLSILHQYQGEESTAVYIKGNNNIVEKLQIETNGMGIVIDRSQQNQVNQVTIEGTFKESNNTNMKNGIANGIDLFGSHENIMTNIQINHVQDGIYIESGLRNRVENCTVKNSRYGFHLMFTEDTVLKGNTSELNITGAMVMDTTGTKIIDNRFSKNSYHVHSQGLLLFDVVNGTISDNEFSENLIGLYIEKSENNSVKDNLFLGNFIGLQLRQVRQHTISKNEFITNVIQGQATESSTNELTNNYWDDHVGLDFTGNRESDLTYKADPIFLALIDNSPALQILSQSPGMLFFNSLLSKNEFENLSDPAPLMDPISERFIMTEEKDSLELVFFSLVALISTTIIILGGKRK